MAQTRKRARKKVSEEEAQAPRTPVCPVGFCPVGMFLTVADRARPEAVQHLLAAGRELILAMTAVLDTRGEDVARSSRIEKIELE